MAYITKEAVQKCLDDLSCENLIGNENDTFISLAEAKDRIEELPTADVVPKSEVDDLEYALTGEVNSLEYTLEGVMHSVDKWLEGDELRQDEVNRAATMREKTLRIVERLQEALSKSEADVKNYMKVAEHQQSISVKRYHEINRLKEDVERLEDINNRDVENLRLAKAEVAREIFEEIEKYFYNNEYKTGVLLYCNFFNIKKKYTGETP